MAVLMNVTTTTLFSFSFHSGSAIVVVVVAVIIIISSSSSNWLFKCRLNKVAQSSRRSTCTESPVAVTVVHSFIQCTAADAWLANTDASFNGSGGSGGGVGGLQKRGEANTEREHHGKDIRDQNPQLSWLLAFLFFPKDSSLCDNKNEQGCCYRVYFH